MYASVWLVSTATEPLRFTATDPETPPSTLTPCKASEFMAVIASPETVCVTGVAIRSWSSLGLVKLFPEPVKLALIGFGATTPTDESYGAYEMLNWPLSPSTELLPNPLAPMWAPAPMKASVVLVMTGTPAAAPMLAVPDPEKLPDKMLSTVCSDAATRMLPLAWTVVAPAGRVVRVVADECSRGDQEDINSGRSDDRDGADLRQPPRLPR